MLQQRVEESSKASTEVSYDHRGKTQSSSRMWIKGGRRTSIIFIMDEISDSRKMLYWGVSEIWHPFQRSSKTFKSCAQCEQSCIQCFVSSFKFGIITIWLSQFKGLDILKSLLYLTFVNLGNGLT